MPLGPATLSGGGQQKSLTRAVLALTVKGCPPAWTAQTHRVCCGKGMPVAGLLGALEAEASVMSAPHPVTSRRFSASEQSRQFVAKGDELLINAKRVSKTITRRVADEIVLTDLASG